MTPDELARLDDKGMAAWEAHKPDEFAALFADRFVWQDDAVPEEITSAAGVRDYMSQWFTAFPDMHSVETNRVIGDDSVAVEIEFTGTNSGPLRMGGRDIPATGRSVTGHGTYFVRAENGKIVEFHTHPDTTGMMMQLGLMPAS